MYLLNKVSAGDRQVTLDLPDNYRLVHQSSLTAEELTSYNTADKRAVIVESMKVEPKAIDSVDVPAKTLLVLELAR